jgi:hypothetical protein
MSSLLPPMIADLDLECGSNSPCSRDGNSNVDGRSDGCRNGPFVPLARLTGFPTRRVRDRYGTLLLNSIVT